MAVAVDGGEARLVAEARRGDASAFDALAEQHRRGLYQLAMRWLRDSEAALDCVQETLLRAYQSLPRFREQCALSTWLSRILEHVCAEERRRREREVRWFPHLEWALPPTVEETLSRRLDLSDALRALAELPLTLRTTALLGLVEGRSPLEVSGLLGISLAAVKMRLSRARALMAAMPALSEEGETVRSLLSDGYRELASLALQQGRDQEAGDALRRSLQIAPPWRGYEVWNWHFQRRGTPYAAAAQGLAWEMLEEANARPACPGVVIGLAQMHTFEEGGDSAIAARLYMSLLGLRDENGSVARKQLGWLYLRLGRYRQALPWLAAGMELATSPPDGYIIGNIAYCLARCRRPAARGWAERTAAFAAGPPQGDGPVLDSLHRGNAHSFAAKAFDALGDTATARRELLAASRILPPGFREADDTFLSLAPRLLGGTWLRA